MMRDMGTRPQVASMRDTRHGGAPIGVAHHHVLPLGEKRGRCTGQWVSEPCPGLIPSLGGDVGDKQDAKSAATEGCSASRMGANLMLHQSKRQNNGKKYSSGCGSTRRPRKLNGHQQKHHTAIPAVGTNSGAKQQHPNHIPTAGPPPPLLRPFWVTPGLL